MPFTAMNNLAAGDLVTEADMDALRGNIDYLNSPNVVYAGVGALTTTSTTSADIAGLSAVHTAYGGVSLICATMHHDRQTVNSGNANYGLYVDSTMVRKVTGILDNEYLVFVYATAMASGAHIIKTQWAMDWNTGGIYTGYLWVMGG